MSAPAGGPPADDATGVAFAAGAATAEAEQAGETAEEAEATAEGAASTAGVAIDVAFEAAGEASTAQETAEVAAETAEVAAEVAVAVALSTDDRLAAIEARLAEEAVLDEPPAQTAPTQIEVTDSAQEAGEQQPEGVGSGQEGVGDPPAESGGKQGRRGGYRHGRRSRSR